MTAFSQGHCQCKAVEYEIREAPVLRIICHCTACQEFNEADYADICIFQKGDIDLPRKDKVDYKAYTKPPMVQRGKCKQCGKPAIEFLDNPVSPKLVIVPSANVENQSALPEPSFHTFYHRRKKDWNDDVNKYSGFAKSQAMFMLNYFRKKRR